MGFDGAGADEEGFGDFAVGLALGEEPEDFLFASGQAERIPGRACGVALSGDCTRARNADACSNVLSSGCSDPTR